MIPKKLTIEGLYSYQAPQTIDFEELTAAGLFGIFGKVGSGKSAILEAITVALYGGNDRLGRNVASSYDLMNLKSNRLHISLEFWNYENRLFRVDRKARRNSRQFQDVKKEDGGVYEWEGAGWQPVAGRSTEDIVGMNYENFRRTIIIPQGKFREFMELGNKDRTEMLKEIFGLHRYDLSAQVKQLREANAAAVATLQGEMGTLEAHTPEALERELAARATRTAQVAQAAEAVKHLTGRKTELESLHEATLRHTQRQETLRALEAQQGDFGKIKEETDAYERMHKLFAQPLAKLGSAKDQLETQQTRLAAADASLKETVTNLETLDDKNKTLQPRLAAMETMTKKAADYARLAEAAMSADKMKEAARRVQNGEKMSKDLEAETTGLEQQRKQTEATRKALKAQLLPAEVLAGLKSWYDRQAALREAHTTTATELTALQEKMKRNLAEAAGLGVEPNGADAYFAQQKKILNDRLQAAEDKVRGLEIQERLAHFAENLQPGVPCPLCGCPEHPHILAAASISAEVQQARQAVLTLKKQQENLLAAENRMQQYLTIDRTLTEQQAGLLLRLNRAAAEQQTHLQAFLWKDFSAEDNGAFQLAYHQQEKIRGQVEQAERQLEELQLKIQSSGEKLKKYQKTLEQLRLEHKGHEGEIKSAHRHLEVLSPAAAEGQEAASLKDRGESLRKEVAQIQQEEQTLTKQLAELNQKKAAQQAEHTLMEERVKELSAEQKAAEQDLGRLLAQEQTDLPTVEATLRRDLPVEARREQVATFLRDLEKARSLWEEAAAAVAGRTFLPEELEKITETLRQKTAEEQQLRAELGAADQRILTLEKNLQWKAELARVLAEQQRRADNLQTMKNLFDRQGFVDFISSEYLRQLVAAANERFHRMTNHQLSLEVNERNGFDVADYLNEGRRRSLKTLSGGQSFQASLSLALALAESVQSQAQATQNFFFIDEGFGTQDAESVSIVFDTLQDLQKGNRIVGIISHLDELKERIPVSLEVRNHPETGSEVRKTEN